MFRKIFPTIIFLIVLNACTNNSPVITPTIAIGPIAAYTATPLSTASLSATLEPSPTPYFINTARTATVQAFNQLIDVFPGMCDSYRNSLLKSADGNWLAQDCSGDSLRIIYKNGSTKREVTYKEIFEKGENYPYNQGAIYPKH